MRAGSLLLALLCMGGVLTGCGKETTPTQPSVSSQQVPGYLIDDTSPLDRRGAEVRVGSVVADSAESKQIARVWVRFWTVRATAFASGSLDPADLERVATGEAKSATEDYLTYLRLGRERSRGDVRLRVSEIVVRERRATVAGCLVNRSRNYDAAGKATEMEVPSFRLRGQLVRVGQWWLVSEFSARRGACP